MSIRATSVSQMYTITPGVPYNLDLTYPIGAANTIAPMTYKITSKTIAAQLRVEIKVPSYFSVDRRVFLINPGTTELVTITFLPEEANRVAQTSLQQKGNIQIGILPVNLTGPVLVN
jgi:hypothetical protein